MKWYSTLLIFKEMQNKIAMYCDYIFTYHQLQNKTKQKNNSNTNSKHDESIEQ